MNECVYPAKGRVQGDFLEMNTLKMNKAVVVIWLAISLLVGGGLVAPAMGFDVIPQTYACGGGSGGGC